MPGPLKFLALIFNRISLFNPAYREPTAAPVGMK